VSASPRRIAGLALVLFLTTQPAQALIPDPVESALVSKIAAVLKLIEQVRMQVLEKMQQQIRNRLRTDAFPQQLFGAIGTTTAIVVDMRRELQRMACDWPMSSRTRSLGDLFQERAHFCRSSFRDVWGSHELLWDGPLQEVHDYVGTMTANMISERTDKTYTTWVWAHTDLFDGHATLLNSPGEANRAEAAALAWANQVALGNSQVLTQDLLVRQMSRDLERFDQKKAADITYYTYRSLSTLAGGDWRGAPPPAEQEGAR
jgi:hypothetical protein